MPQSPPPLSDLFGELNQNQNKLLELVGPASKLVDPRYFHWDELRHRPAPKGYNQREMWLATKMARLGQYRTLPLLDKMQRPFVYSVTDRILAGLHKLDQEAGGTIAGTAQTIADSSMRDRYYFSSLMEEAITSSQLEGAATTRQVAKEMIRTGRKPRDRSETMILNNFQAMEHIRQMGKENLTPEHIFELHRTLTEETLDQPDAAGRLRRLDEPITVADDFGEVYHIPPPASELESRLNLLCQFANDVGTAKDSSKPFLHPALRAVILHFWLAYDHPFVDGNGRTARALFYWSMRRSGYWLIEFISISNVILKAPKQYYKAFLYTETDENDLTYFLHHQLGVLESALVSLHEYIVRKSNEFKELSSLSRLAGQLNHRQAALIKHALRHPEQTYTIQSHQTSHQVVYQTARNDLMELEQKGFLQRLPGEGKKIVYIASPDLNTKLKANY